MSGNNAPKFRIAGWYILLATILVVAGLTLAFFLGRSSNAKRKEGVADQPTLDSGSSKPPATITENNVQTGRIPTVTEAPKATEQVDLSPKSLIGSPVHAGVYSFRGIELSSPKRQVLAQLKHLGIDLAPFGPESPGRYDQTNSFPGIAKMRVLFDPTGALTDIDFTFDGDTVSDYLKAVEEFYGPPTYPIHDLPTGGTASDWRDGSSEPCRSIRVADTGPPQSADQRRKGNFYLQRFDTTIIAGTDLHLCTSS